MSRKTLAYVGLGLLLLLGGRLLASRPAGTPPAPRVVEEASAPVPPTAPPSARAPLAPLRGPTVAMAEYGVLTDRDPTELAARIDREALAAALPARLCGDAAACEAVRRTILTEHLTHLQVVASGDWSLEALDLDAAARGLPAAIRAEVKKKARVVVVHVSAAPSAEQLPLRAALAVAAFVAERTAGLVWDQLLERIETPAAAAALAITEPLGRSVFRRDRIALLYESRPDGVVRVLTGGLSRWGVADVEAAAVPAAAAEGVGDVVLGVAQALADGAGTSPVTLSRDDLGRARGRAYASDAGLPPVAPIEVDVVSVHPEAGDPNDFMARIEPESGDGPLAYVDLAERFLGPLLRTTGGGAAQRDRAQAALGPALAAWTAGKSSGARLAVEVPFAIPGDAGVEEVWIEVTSFDGARVTGRVMDDPLAATDVHKGDVVTRGRGEVEEVDLKR